MADEDKRLTVCVSLNKSELEKALEDDDYFKHILAKLEFQIIHKMIIGWDSYVESNGKGLFE